MALFLFGQDQPPLTLRTQSWRVITKTRTKQFFTPPVRALQQVRKCLRLNSPVHGVSIVDQNERVVGAVAKTSEQSTGGVSVTLKKAGGGAGETLWADAVIIAVPLSLLQNEALTFDPPIPPVSVCFFRGGGGDLCVARCFLSIRLNSRTCRYDSTKGTTGVQDREQFVVGFC